MTMLIQLTTSTITTSTTAVPVPVPARSTNANSNNNSNANSNTNSNASGQLNSPVAGVEPVDMPVSPSTSTNTDGSVQGASGTPSKGDIPALASTSASSPYKPTHVPILPTTVPSIASTFNCSTEFGLYSVDISMARSISTSASAPTPNPVDTVDTDTDTGTNPNPNPNSNANTNQCIPIPIPIPTPTWGSFSGCDYPPDSAPFPLKIHSITNQASFYECFRKWSYKSHPHRIQIDTYSFIKNQIPSVELITPIYTCNLAVSMDGVEYRDSIQHKDCILFAIANQAIKNDKNKSKSKLVGDMLLVNQ